MGRNGFRAYVKGHDKGMHFLGIGDDYVRLGNRLGKGGVGQERRGKN